MMKNCVILILAVIASLAIGHSWRCETNDKVIFIEIPSKDIEWCVGAIEGKIDQAQFELQIAKQNHADALKHLDVVIKASETGAESTRSIDTAKLRVVISKLEVSRMMARCQELEKILEAAKKN